MTLKEHLAGRDVTCRFLRGVSVRNTGPFGDFHVLANGDLRIGESPGWLLTEDSQPFYLTSVNADVFFEIDLIGRIPGTS